MMWCSFQNLTMLQALSENKAGLAARGQAANWPDRESCCVTRIAQMITVQVLQSWSTTWKNQQAIAAHGGLPRRNCINSSPMPALPALRQHTRERIENINFQLGNFIDSFFYNYKNILNIMQYNVKIMMKFLNIPNYMSIYICIYIYMYIYIYI